MQRGWWLFGVVTVLLVGLTLTSCGGTATPSPVESPPAPLTPTAGPSPSPQSEATPAGIAVVDALGRNVVFATLPQRIVIAGKNTLPMVDTVYLFPEAKERVVGLTVGKQPVGDFIGLVDPDFGQKTILDPEAGPEQIAPLKPDAVILRSFLADTLGRSLEEIGIPVVYVDLETPEQYFRDLSTLGQLLGNEARAEQIRSFYQSRLDLIAAGLQGLKEEEKPQVLLAQYTDQGGTVALQVPSASWIQTTEVELAGGHPVWKEAAQSGGWTVVNFEQIAAWNPDQIVVIVYKGNSAQVVATLKQEPTWQALKAVKDGKVFGFPADIFSWDQPDPRWILGTLWLAGKIHPDRFPDLEIKQQVADFFGQMYGMDQAAIQNQIVPTLKGDIE